MKKPVEKRTNWEIVITYLFVAFLCCFMFYFVYNLRNSVQNQKINIDTQNKTLALTSQLTQAVHEAQSAANLFAFSGNNKYLKDYNDHCKIIVTLSDSIILVSGKSEIEEMLTKIEELTTRKGQMSYLLSRQLYYYDPFKEIDQSLENHVPEKPKPIFVQSTIQDTIVQKSSKKSFWRRVGEVFSPQSNKDSVYQLRTQTIDTIQMAQTDSSTFIADLQELSNKAKLQYKSKVEEYEKHTKELIADDNALSEQLSTLLLQLNQETLQSSIIEIEKSEEIIEKNTRKSTIIGAIVLFLIIVFIFMIINDVNKGFRARQAAEEAQKRAEELMESRHKLLLGVSHDIKTPLTSIIGSLELMENQEQEQIVSMKQSAQHILNLLSSLLEFSSLEQGKLQVTACDFNIGEVCDEIDNMFKPIALNKNLSFIYQNEIGDACWIHSDRLKIVQILSNLISNSLKYTLDGSVTFAASQSGQTLHFVVEDTGVGIPEDKLEEIFKPFVRIETYNSFAEGSGYGMSVVKGLIDLLQGEIRIESEVGKGSRFIVDIPFLPCTLEETAGSVNGDQPNLTATKSLKILIIDDDTTLLSVLDKMLSRLGHKAVACQSTDAFNDSLSTLSEYDYVLTDREMGALTGNRILARVKDVDPQKKVILMTARIEYSLEKAHEEGFDGFLQKPFTMNDLSKLFNTQWTEEKIEKSRFIDDFPDLCQMLGDDDESIQKVLEAFTQSTSDDLVALNDCITENDFAKAQSICHKMRPMFTQLGQTKAVDFLSKMDALRGATENVFPEWKEETEVFMDEADALLSTLAEKYNIN